MKFNSIVFFLLVCTVQQIKSQALLIHKTKQPIIIDGNLSDWHSPFSKEFVIHNSGDKAKQSTVASLSWDKNFLYIAYKCMDSEIIGKARKQDSHLFETDDLVEIFISPIAEVKSYIEIGVNAFSSNYDVLIQCIRSDCAKRKSNLSISIKGLQTASKITDSGYSVEIAIPFSSLNEITNGDFKTPKIGTTWKGNLFRIDYGQNKEYQSLKQYQSKKHGFHQPAEFAELQFVK
ncbi:carbohydrate-binding family 9-like protein [Flavobacterium weaverense]|uniref:Carbohydrate binding protein with CBM9 domain n=1 Tax=Flavobacterium weaverense TaxID=271156 RepID=A0A3M0A5L2_9FLAO|nr:carbohydrate-binding family 9-like protein [Flavobacterium weaverense]RMA77755.1 carbohydrate binding protein with CBM9 domain [Flavobacterium weaverense]